MLRSALTIALVALLAAWIAQAERHGAAPSAAARKAAAATPQSQWVRTADGWQPRGVLAIESPPVAPLHPGLIAGFQLAFSLLVLIALPGQAKPVAAVSSAARGATMLPPGSAAAPTQKRRRRISRPVSA